MFEFFGIPLYIWLFIIAAVAALSGWLLVGRVRDDAGSFPGWILYAVAAGFAIIALATLWLNAQV